MDKISDESIALVRDVFEQGDSRYYDSFSINIVANFLEDKAIIIEKKMVKDVYTPSKEELKLITPPQEQYKFIGKKLLEEKGYQLIGFEVPFCGGRTDILARNPSKKETVAVECCSCRTDKAIDYLENKNTVLWVLSLGKTGLPGDKLPLFIIKRGPNWDSRLKIYKQSIKEQLKKVKSPLDTL